MVSSNTNICFITLGALSASCLTFPAIFTVFESFSLFTTGSCRKIIEYTCSEVNINKISIFFIQHTHTHTHKSSWQSHNLTCFPHQKKLHVWPSIQLSAWTTWLRLNRFSWNLWIFFKKTVQKIWVWLKPDKNTRYYTKTCVHLW